MAQKVSIPITDHNDGTTCTGQYNIRYRPTGVPQWTDIPPQYDSPVVLNNLLNGTDYEFQITRTCCGGVVSPVVNGSFSTGS